MVISSLNGYIYVSNNSGSTWNSCSPSTSLIWGCVSISGNGNIIYAGAIQDYIYYSSNGGTSWSTTNPSYNLIYNWSSICSSYDGSIVYACVNGGDIYISNNNTDVVYASSPRTSEEVNGDGNHIIDIVT